MNGKKYLLTLDQIEAYSDANMDYEEALNDDDIRGIRAACDAMLSILQQCEQEEHTCRLEGGYGDAGGKVGKVCSECKTTVEFHWREPPNYCANCGAKVVE